MRKIYFIAGIFSFLFISSCQKEIDWGIAGGGSTSGTLLVKIVQHTGTDSTVSEYNYDASKRLIRENVTGQSGSTDISSETSIVRNAAGIVTKTIQKAAALILVGIDSVETRVHYDQASSHYTSTVFELLLFGFTITDSAAFTYDASGKIVSDIHYQSFLSLPYAPALKEEYTYSAGGDITVLKQYSYDQTAMTYNLASTNSFTYDTKTNPLKMNNDAFAITRPTYYSAHNATQSDFVDVTDPTNDFSISFVYTYNSNNRPVSAVSTQNPGATVTNAAFYYQ